jgi:uncharacterized protein GlcG (DUF336 family)
MNKVSFIILAIALSACSSKPVNVATTQPAAAANRPAPQPPARGPELALAIEAARAALDFCAAQDQKAGVSVVDSAGGLRVLLAADGTSVRGVQSSTIKAQTAIAFKTATSNLFEQAKTEKELADKIAAEPKYNGRPGGVLLKVNGEIIGAIGVGGARIDEPCALAGLQKVQDRLK